MREREIFGTGKMDEERCEEYKAWNELTRRDNR